MTYGEMIAREVATEGRDMLNVILGLQDVNVILAQELSLSVTNERTAKLKSGSRIITVTITEPKERV